MTNTPDTNVALVEALISQQFPEWKGLAIEPVATSGWDNRTFRLGNHLLVRMPSAQCYASQVEKEHQWLPKLAPQVSLNIPKPIALGKPANGYPWEWSVYEWIEGEQAGSTTVDDPNQFARRLAAFLISLQQANTAGGPPPGAHNFHRGGCLSVYDAETRRSINLLKGKINTTAAIAVWEAALDSAWEKNPVWVHGDISPENLLVRNDALSAVIDFGLLCIGDPACDLTIAWTFLDSRHRDTFRKALSPDENTWARGRAWALWKALITASDPTKENNTQCWNTLDAIFSDDSPPV